MDHSIKDLERRARAYLPRVLYDWVAGGAEDELGLRASVADFARVRLVPRYGNPAFQQTEKSTWGFYVDSPSPGVPKLAPEPIGID